MDDLTALWLSVSVRNNMGEDGFELSCPADEVVSLWQVLLGAGKEHGLPSQPDWACDTLRLEAAYCLYEHELTEQTNPLEAGRSNWRKVILSVVTRWHVSRPRVSDNRSLLSTTRVQGLHIYL